MDISILAAKILALTYIAAGIATLTGAITFGRVIEEFEKSQALTFVSGFFTLVLGMLLVTYHNHWVKNWTALITLVGWLSLMKGILPMAFPRHLSFFKRGRKNRWVWGGLMITLGLLFGYFGFASTY